MVLILVLLATQFYSAWSNYSKTLGQSSSINNWLKDRLNSRALDIYDLVFAIHRLQTICFLYERKIIDVDDLENHRMVTASMLNAFKGETKLAKSLEEIESYRDGIEATNIFIEKVISFENNRTTIDKVYYAGEGAIDSLVLLKGDAVQIEFTTIDQIANTVKTFQDVIAVVATRVVVLFFMCLVAIISFAFGVAALWRGQQRRFKRFEWLVASIGHDLRGPLQTLESASHMLTKSTITNDKVRYGSMISSALLNLSRLVNDMLMVVRYEEISLVQKYVNAEKWFSLYVQSYKIKIDQNSKLKFKSLVNVQPMQIEVDESMLTQCITNMLDNSFRYTENGSISLKININPIKNDYDHQLLTITVADTGIGIAQEDYERIFDPFERATTVARKQGKGLGLSIVKHIVNEMGGTVKIVDSKVNVGSTFKIDIPVRFKQLCENNEVESAKIPSKISLKPPKTGDKNVEIILVDDDESIIESMSAVLIDAGFGVLATKDVDLVISTIKAENCRMLITDIEMPKMNGFQLGKLAKDILPNIFIVAMTGHTTNLDQKQFKFDAVLYKPVRLNQILDVIDMANLES
ncbi:ATPase/histidine kinase/DNA gyrase B/HSP90 domain protein [Rhodoferax antarcticus ANT.BR]|uniref:histidine kinase n=2 Tax=Rhodoferax antarcticus TaxID=81479 RepID=A0A1Q8Y9G6_9BURK|nr:ATPase/histidine kinase/DNA gyrase B/HSP90 domain protein [Rhodoferax antarcticus ANT.BR]